MQVGGDYWAGRLLGRSMAHGGRLVGLRLFVSERADAKVSWPCWWVEIADGYLHCVHG